MDRLDDPEELRAVATKAEDKTIAVRAFERLTAEQVSRELLEQVAKRAKQKAVQRRARAALHALDRPAQIAADATAPPVADTGDHEGLCAKLEAVRGEENLDHGRETLDRLLQQWSELDQALDAETRTRFAAARTAAETRLVELESRVIAQRREDEIRSVAASAAKQQAREERLGERLQEMERLLNELEQLVGNDAAARSSKAWSTAAARFRSLVSEVGDAGGDTLKTLLSRHDAVEQAQSTRTADREKSEQSNLKRLTHLISTIKGLVGSEKLQLAEAERQMRSLRRAVDKPGALPRLERDAVERQLKQVHTGLLGRVRELRDFADWQRWANLGVQEDLCRRMEALRELSDDAEVIERFRDLMTRWREAADVPKDKGDELWKRFKAAHDEVNPRVEKHRQAQALVREQNLVRQQALVEEAERLSTSTDWLKTVQRVTELQAEWKALGPGPRKQQRDLWSRFRAACNTFFSRRKADLAVRKQQWSANLKVKDELCERVEKLVDAEDLPAAIAAVKQAQAEWKASGPVRRTRSEAIWTRFRSACDAVFDRALAGQREAEAERAAARDALCVEVESLLPEESVAEAPAGLADTVRDLQRRWREAPDVPPPLGRTLTARFGQGLARLVEKFPHAFSGTDLDPARLLKRLEKLCERIEALKPSDGGALQNASPAEILAAKWRDALASNTMGARVDEATERRSAADEVRRAKQDVRRLGKVAGDEGRRLTDRFHAACSQVLKWAEPRQPRPAAPKKSA